MRAHEVRHCPKCGNVLKVVEGSQKTRKDKVWVLLQCDCCLHREMDWYDLPKHSNH